MNIHIILLIASVLVLVLTPIILEILPYYEDKKTKEINNVLADIKEELRIIKAR